MITKTRLQAFGSWISDLRRERGMTADLLAEQARISAAKLAQIESGRRVITPRQMRRVALAFGLTDAEIYAEAFALYDRASNLTGGPKS